MSQSSTLTRIEVNYLIVFFLLLLQVLHTSFNFIKVQVTASLFGSPGFFLVF